MSTVVIPTRTDGTQHYTMKVRLGSSVFQMEFIWNGRDSSWSFVLSDAAGNLLVSRKVTLGTPLLYRFTDTRLPLGEIIAIDTTGSGVEPSVTDLGSRVLLTFTDAADLV